MARESNDSYWSNLREGGKGLIEKQRARQAGRVSGLDFSTCFSFSSMVSLSPVVSFAHSQLYFINHIRADIDDPKQVNALLVFCHF